VSDGLYSLSAVKTSQRDVIDKDANFTLVQAGQNIGNGTDLPLSKPTLFFFCPFLVL
jgi:hypothetical protein